MESPLLTVADVAKYIQRSEDFVRRGMSPAEWWGSRDAFPGGCQSPGSSSAVTAGSVSRTVWSLAIDASEK
jgi:hypothetical protein